MQAQGTIPRQQSASSAAKGPRGDIHGGKYLDECPFNYACTLQAGGQGQSASSGAAKEQKQGSTSSGGQVEMTQGLKVGLAFAGKCRMHESFSCIGLSISSSI
jgi:hypothetical protein